MTTQSRPSGAEFVTPQGFEAQPRGNICSTVDIPALQKVGTERKVGCSGVRSADEGVEVTKLVVAIATAGRPQIVTGMLPHVARQTVKPDRVIIAIAEPSDVNPDDLVLPAEVVVGERGCSRQRNAVLDRVGPDDIVIFIDDDFLMAPNFCEEVRNLFDQNPSVVMATGHVIADGIIGPGFGFEEAEHLLSQQEVVSKPKLRPVYNCYGCNMVLRAGPALEHGVRFDANLPLYGWLEDLDYSRQMAAFGEIVHSNTLQGVHMGTKVWRTPGLKLGYSQVANPSYLVWKGTMSFPRAIRIMLRNLGMNLLRSPRPEAWVDRRGRLRGNLLALKDLASGRLCPQRAEKLK
ncbi:MAG: glycosyltransferase [Rhodobacteraceae bacterium]|nr:MAG: glycosyltransferase [Paracoccaceae bacterium]